MYSSIFFYFFVVERNVPINSFAPYIDFQSCFSHIHQLISVVCFELLYFHLSTRYLLLGFFSVFLATYRPISATQTLLPVPTAINRSSTHILISNSVSSSLCVNMLYCPIHSVKSCLFYLPYLVFLTYPIFLMLNCIKFLSEIYIIIHIVTQSCIPSPFLSLGSL